MTMDGQLRHQRLAGRANPRARIETETSGRSGANDGLLVPVVALLFVAIVAPLLNYNNSATSLAEVQVSVNRLENKIFWPLAACAALFVFFKYRSRIAGSPLPFHLSSLALVLCFSVCSVLWAFKPEVTTVRLATQLMICAAFVLPIMVAGDKADFLRAAFYCLAVTAFVNVVFIGLNSRHAVAFYLGYPGIHEGKNAHGMIMAAGFILALGRFATSPSDRGIAIVSLLATAYCLRYSNSKTAFALAFLAPMLAVGFLVMSRQARLSPAAVAALLAGGAFLVMQVTGYSAGRISDLIYRDSTFSGRIFIWEYLTTEINQRWLLGWGFNSFWQVGPDGPSIINAPGWIKNMPSGHSGYMDIAADLGYVGLALVLVFVFATLHAIGPVCRRDPARGWILLSLALYIIIYNFLESIWLRGFDPLWVMFLVVAAEAARSNYAARPIARAAGATEGDALGKGGRVRYRRCAQLVIREPRFGTGHRSGLNARLAR